MRFALLVCLLVCLLATTASAWEWKGRRAVLRARGELMLAENLTWKKQDCSLAAWRMLRDLWPELALVKWFKRTTAEAMAGWPWPALMRLKDAEFGDLLFTRYHDTNTGRIDHVLIGWDEPETAVHAAKSRGFSQTRLRPHWWPKIAVAIRPPY